MCTFLAVKHRPRVGTRLSGMSTDARHTHTHTHTLATRQEHLVGVAVVEGKNGRRASASYLFGVRRALRSHGGVLTHTSQGANKVRGITRKG